MITLILALVLAMVTALFALQNTDMVTVQFLFWEHQTSLVLVILGSAGSGIALALLASLGGRWKSHRTRRSLEAGVQAKDERIRALEEELRSLREVSSPRPPDNPAASNQ